VIYASHYIVYTYDKTTRLWQVEKAIFLWCAGTPLSATEKPEKSPAAIDGAGTKMAVFFGKNSPCWGQERLFF
jgi:hypothetical protein